MKTLPRALQPWCLDSGAFTEISSEGQFSLSARDYVDEARRYSRDIGQMQWAAIQDWMCEPFITNKTGLSVEEHQRRTTYSFLTLKWMAPEINWIPVLQGWEHDDYLRHLDHYHRAVPWPLHTFRTVGLGSVCRRQGTVEADAIIWDLFSRGLKLHAFGFKLTGLKKSAHMLASADSMAWSYSARRSEPLLGCTHKRCNNCMKYALLWRERALELIGTPKQGRLFG